MTFPTELLLVTSSVGAFQSGFFGVYFLSSAEKDELNKRLLGALFLALSIRIGKSVGYYFSDGNLPIILENIGYAANLAIAPLLYLYVRRAIRNERIAVLSILLHLAPAIAALIFSPVLGRSFWLGSGNGYLISLYFSGAYFPFIYAIVLQKFGESQRRLLGSENKLVLMLVCGLNMVWLAYFANFVLGMVQYISAPVTFSLVIYPISFFIISNYESLYLAESKPKSYENSNLSREELAEFREKIHIFLEYDDGCTDPTLTLSKLSKALGVSKHTASEAVNRGFETGFSNLVNTYRIVRAKALLSNPKNRELKIAAIADRCGFRSISGFNTLFKRETKMTPSEYRSEYASKGTKF